MRGVAFGDIGVEDWGEHPGERPRGARRRPPWIRLGLTSGMIVAVLVLYARGPAPPDPLAARLGPPAPALAPPPAWTPVPRPAPVVGLDAPELAGLPGFHEARRHAGGGREDTLVVGALAGEEPHLRLVLTRPGAVEEPAPSFFVDLARRAAGAGAAVVRSSQPAPLATKFGLMEVAAVTLEGLAVRDCLAFRLDRSDPRVVLAGWTCGTVARPATRAGLACQMDRLRRVGGVDDPTLFGLFREAEARRLPGCAPPRTAAAAPTR